MTETTETTVSTNFAALLTGEDVTAAPVATPLEKALATVDKAAEVEVKSPTDAVFKFRDLLNPTQRADLEKHAPAVAAEFVNDVNKVIAFGGGTIDKMRETSISMLASQKQVEIPEADQVVNDLLREMDGFQKKYRNVKFEEFSKRAFGFFKSAQYSVKTLHREMKPIEDKLDLAELKLEEMDFKLRDNITRGQELHAQVLRQMDEVVSILAALEEIIEVIRGQYLEADALLQEATATGAQSVVWSGESITVNELQEHHANLSLALNETEKTWHDWRQQFFLGWAMAPATRNLVISTIALRRRLNVFKSMGIQSGRQALVIWKQAIEAKQGALVGNAVQDATNKMIQSAFQEVAETTGIVAQASQASVITEETIHSMLDSVKAQARGIVEADRAGRALRARNIQAIEHGEVEIRDEVLSMQAQLANNQRAAAGITSSAGEPELTSNSDASSTLLGKL